MGKVLGKSGGYRKLYSFNFATIVHLGVLSFCKRFVPWQEDPLGKVVGQMVGAARSGRINIAEGSERAGTSSETEIKLTDVARASLAELQNDFETWLAERELVPWSANDPEHQAVTAIKLAPFEYTDDTLHDYWVYLQRERHKFDRWLRSDDPALAANALIVLIQRTTALLSRQMESQEEDFVNNGGIRERMHRARVEAAAAQEGAPECPKCGKAMRKRNSAKGEFWGCSGYPGCKGTRSVVVSQVVTPEVRRPRPGCGVEDARRSTCGGGSSPCQPGVGLRESGVLALEGGIPNRAR
jgi:four helix bundle suffix protein